MMKKTLFMLTLLLLFGGALTADKSTFDPTICPVGPMKFMGEVFITTLHNGTKNINLSAEVWKGGVAASGGVMTLMGERATNEREVYHHSLSWITIGAGGMVRVTFQPPWATLPLYSAALAAPVPLKFISPVSAAHVRVAGPGNLTVSWSGGTPPYALNIWKSGTGTKVFHRTGIAVGSVDVPLATFSPGLSYSVTVYDAKRKFAFDHAVDPVSDLGLDQRTNIIINAD
jgi:hypothetical protein